MDDKIPDDEKTRRIMIVNEKQRAIQIRRNTDLIGTVKKSWSRDATKRWASGSAAPPRTVP